MRFILTSNSPVKKEITFNILKEIFNNELIDLEAIDTHHAQTATQPLNEGILICACKRILYVEENYHSEDAIIISIENGINVNNIKVKDNQKAEDICLVVVHDNKTNYQYSEQSFPIDIPFNFYQKAIKESNVGYELRHLGLDVTVGSIIHSAYPDIPANNWMAHSMFGGIDRKTQIADPLRKCLLDYKYNIYNNNNLQKKLLYFNNFPKFGVIFKDLSQILADPILFKDLIETAVYKLKKVLNNHNQKVDKVVGLDARGFIYGPLLAYQLGAGFVMARKKGKLPSSVLSVEYGTEYSFDSIEIMENMIEPGDNVVIVDDLVATGGSLQAARKLVEGIESSSSVGASAGAAAVVAYLCMLEVDELQKQAKEKLGDQIPLVIAIKE